LRIFYENHYANCLKLTKQTPQAQKEPNKNINHIP